MPSNSSEKLHSLINILGQLDGGKKVTAALLSESIGVSERTIYRYMMTLQNAGYPIFFDHDKMTYRFADGFSLKRYDDKTELYQGLEIKSRLLGSSPIGLLAYTESGQCVAANESAASITGGTRQQLLTQNFYDIPSWKSSGLLYVAQEVLRTGIEHSNDFHSTSSFGKEIWTFCSLSRFKQEGQYFLLMIMHDRTDRKLMELSLQESEALLSLFLEHSPAYAFIKDDQLKVVQASRNYEQLLGKPLEQIIGKTMSEQFPAEFAKKMELRDHEILASNSESEIEEEFNGRHFTTIKFPFERGSRKYLAGYAIDVTDRKIAEQKLVMYANQFQVLAQTTLDAFWVVNSEGYFLDVNDKACQMLGYSRDELLRMNIHDIEANENPDQVQQHVKRVLKSGYDRFETRHRKKDGLVIDVEVSTSRMPDSGTAIAFVREITNVGKG